MIEWFETTVGDFAPFTYGKSLPERDRKSGIIKVFGSGGISGYNNEPLVNNKGIIVGRKGTIGTVQLSEEPFYPIDTVFYIEDEPQKRDLKFTYYLLQTLGLEKMNNDSAVPGLSREQAHALKIRIPKNIEHQKFLSKKLSVIDDKIELNTQINTTLESIAKAIFKEWFIDFGPVKAKAEGKKPFGMDEETAALFPDGFEASELGEIPRGWRVSAIYDLAEWQNGMAFKPGHFTDAGLPIIKIAELKSGIDGSTKKTDQNHEEKFKIKDGEILFSWSGSPDTSIDTFIWDKGDAWLNQHIFKVTAKDTGRDFVYSLLKYLKPVFIETARNRQTTGLGHVTVADLKRLKAVLPSSDIIKTFNKIVEPLLSKYFLNLKENLSLVKIRDLLLPKLISGEIDLQELAS